jgi:hypothetical protein
MRRRGGPSKFTTAGPLLSRPIRKAAAPIRAAYTGRNAMLLPASTPYQNMSAYSL